MPVLSQCGLDPSVTGRKRRALRTSFVDKLSQINRSAELLAVASRVQVLHAVLVDFPETPLGSRMSTKRGPVHHAADVFLNGPGRNVIHEDPEAHLFRTADLLEAGIGAQGVFKRERTSTRTVLPCECCLPLASPARR